ncbi:hydrogenase expression/formation C-terminal domain-containing protein [Candidatus Thiodictyon syntrophicum]|jgi:hydrogenase-1 operon protein HyaF|uniref:Hydrogenase expression protein HupH n=1 Tax=Candidatus Thiodictyon syntrophicum TaxID=1166950 RepID=A0A2K8UFU7_9GAMM|nr:hydrogenase expression/formation C-terminal domain-containing protein [Candidatus Thiodictyon syntrophicum]AUB84422.1 hydrogenase expression protein HupH [Candidatus Thiodictyon syntrophicum]
MSGLSSIPVRVAADGDACHGNALAILHEVRHALERLISTGEATRIDLHALPFGAGDEAWLTALLGTGEVLATIEALGPTSVQETAIPGVWLVDYRNAEGQRLALHLEVTCIPAILRTQCRELDTAVATLDTRLSTATPGGSHPLS